MNREPESHEKTEAERAPAPAQSPLPESNAPADGSKKVPPSQRDLGSVFRIVKADPKNTLDFEDVADK